MFYENLKPPFLICACFSREKFIFSQGALKSHFAGQNNILENTLKVLF